MKIIIITNIPAPYRVDLFNRIHQEWISKGYYLKIIFLTKNYRRRKWNINISDIKFEFSIADHNPISLRESFFSFGTVMIKQLIQEKPDVVILGGFSVPMILAFFYCRMRQIPCILWSGETIQQSKLRMDILQFRFFIRRWLVSHLTAALVYGNAAFDYMRFLGLKKEQIFYAINTVDTDYFKCETQKIRNTNTQTSEFLQLLYVGHLTKDKGIQYVFQALKKIDHTAIHLHIVGSGPYEHELKQLVHSLDLKNIYFHGFVQKQDLPKHYAYADVFVFPSLYDIWGLVCVEAMAARVPLICSVYAGISQNLTHKFNALLVDPTDVQQLSSGILEMAQNPELRKEIAENANQTLKKEMTLQHTIEGFSALIKFIQS